MSLKGNESPGLQAMASQVEKNSQANMALQPTAQPRSGFASAELGRWAL